MTRFIDIHPAVDSEVADAYDWYEKSQPGLGPEFLDEVARILGEIKTNPARFGYAHTDIREGQLNRFPFAVYYRVHRNRIRVLSVFHSSRDPETWRSRQ